MKCELCHQADAQTVIYKEVGGEKRELYVCKACAAKDAAVPAEGGSDMPATLRQALEQIKCPDGKTSLADLMKVGDAKGILPILDRLFESFGITGHVSHSDRTAEPSCPVCGIMRHEWRKAERLGCPACYEAFSKDLGPEILQMHRSAQHCGKAPARFRAAFERTRRVSQLEVAFRAAVAAEDYEKAAALRVEIASLGGSTGNGGGDVHSS